MTGEISKPAGLVDSATARYSQPERLCSLPKQSADLLLLFGARAGGGGCGRAGKAICQVEGEKILWRYVGGQVWRRVARVRMKTTTTTGLQRVPCGSRAKTG